MLILGNKYKFTNLELQRLNKICGDITTISYKDEKANDVIAQIEEALEENSITTILLNTKAKVDEEIIKYLTNLKFNVEHSKFNFKKYILLYCKFHLIDKTFFFFTNWKVYIVLKLSLNCFL